MRGWIVFAFIALLGLAGFFIWRDYETWFALKGRGATEDVRGWLEVNKAGLLNGRDGFDTTRYDAIIAGRTQCAFLGGYLPRRDGARPHVGHWIAPHRQLDQIAAPEIRKQVAASLSQAAAQNPETLSVGPSALDHGAEALFVRKSGETAKREAGDFHASDGAMHVSVSAADAATIIESGWGQAYPLAGRGNFPVGYVLIYAPRKADDLEVEARILRAAIGQAGAYQCVNLSAGKEER
ncbi:MAG: hypothetical protein WDN76_09030 [Alphaproteobacteria bacterium]